MQEIRLTKGRTAIVDDKDFEFLNQWKWRCVGVNPWLYVCRDRLVQEPKGKQIIYLHKFILFKYDSDSKIVDHINGNVFDNRRCNLRVCNAWQNACNKRIHKGKQFKGVVPVRGKWRARIGLNYKRLHLGYFPTKEKAVDAYDKAAKKHFKEFANLNKVCS